MVSVVNQWANSYGQGVTLTAVTPALQSCVVSLAAGDSVGGGSGTATAGNWLFTIVSWTQDPAIAEVHIGVGDDIHSWWREYPASLISGNVRTSISYTPNTARIAGNIYVAPDGEVTAINVLVVEVSGLGPWDTVAGTNANYAAAAASLSLSLGAPGAASFFIAGVGCDSTASTLTFTPAGYTTLHSLSQTDGSDHLADNQLKSAYLTSSSSSQSISASASPSTDLSGFLIGVYTTGTNPVPANNNPNWPYLKFEAAFGSGFNTPNSELTWTDITNRLWEYDETTGIQYQLGALQSTNLDLRLDNYDNALASLNTASPYYPDILSGTPLRIRAAIGTIAGQTSNRWYVIQRNAQQWPEEIDETYRRNAPATGTDIWAVLSTIGPTPYRGEVYDDNPYAWWTADDQPFPANVLPTTLLNSAPRNTNALSILASPSIAAADNLLFYYTEGGTTTQSTVAGLPPASAIYAVAQQQGWMYGDPQSTPSSAIAGNEVTSSPGSAAWQASGQAGTIGSYGWYLHANDASFPALSGGITVEGWFSYPFYGSGTSFPGGTNGSTSVLQQPESPLTLLELATSSAPVAVLQLDLNGHLNLLTYNGSTATSNSIYTSSDLRSDSWHHVAMTLTTTTWTVYVDGGVAATVSGSATGMTSAWTDLIVNGDMGGGGASAIGTATSLIQSVTNTSSGSPITLTLPNPTTAGNCLVVCVGTTAGTSATVSGITLGGAAGNFAVAKAVQSSTIVDCEIWTDANCAGSQTSVVVTLTGNVSCIAQVMEWSGIVTSSPVDKTSSSTSGSSTYTSGATAALTQPSEIAIGAAMIDVSTGQVGSAAAPWVNATIASGNYSLLTGYQGVPSTAAVTFSGAETGTSGQAVVIATLKATGLVHGGNVAVSHLAVYPSQLPAWRIRAHYWAAISGFGILPAPSNVTVQWSDSYAPDGSGKPLTLSGPAAGTLPDPIPGSPFYDPSQGVLASAVVTANAAATTSGPSAWVTGTGYFTAPTLANLWVQWSGLAPTFQVYTAKAIGAELQSAAVSGSGDSFVANYGPALGGGGSGQTSGLGFIQSAQNTNAGTSVTITLPQSTTAGNCLLVFVGAVGGSTNTVSGITLGGSAGNFASAAAISNSTIIGTAIWTDANCAGGKTSIVVSMTGNSDVLAWAVELAGVTTTPVDRTSTHTGSAGGTTGTWTSNATSALTQANEVVLGAVTMLNASTITGPTTPGWAELSTLSLVSGTMQAGILGVSSTAAQTYSGTSSGGTSYAAAAVTLKATMTNAAPPAAGTSVGDTVAQRIERCLGYGNVTYTGRCIDPAALLVQAALDIGGQQAGQNVQNIAISDGGYLFIDNVGKLNYWQKTHLAAQYSSPVWTIGPSSTQYAQTAKWILDPQRAWNAIEIQPYSPTGASLSIITPVNYSGVLASQTQYGAQPFQVNSYLQSTSEMQSQANWLFTNFGQPVRRAEMIKIDAASYPQAWQLVLGINIGDIVTLEDWQIGDGGSVYTMRVSGIKRRFFFGNGDNETSEASVELQLDPEPSSYWS